MSQQENYDWIKAFKELKELIKGYRNNQKGLIKLLETAGIDVPSDEYPEKNKVPLEHMDPFSFLSLINKHPNAYRRSEFVNKILGKEKVSLVYSSGGYVAVPVVWAAYLQGIPVILRETDYSIGLANRLCIPCSKDLFVTFFETDGYEPPFNI